MATHVFPTMGTVASVRFRGALPTQAVLESVHERLEELEARFSLYRPHSEISLINDGSLRLTQASGPLLAAYELALAWRNDTAGAFTPHRPDGLIDLSGVVKAMAIDDAGRLLREADVRNWLVTVGGDTLSDGAASEGAESADPDGAASDGAASDGAGGAWTAGIVDPLDRTALLCAVPLNETWRAIATSGTSERGEHIWRRPQSGDFTQVSVLARDIITADVLATAILAGGQDTLDQATDRWDIDVLCIDAAGGLAMTPRLREATSVRASFLG